MKKIVVHTIPAFKFVLPFFAGIFLNFFLQWNFKPPLTHKLYIVLCVLMVALFVLRNFKKRLKWPLPFLNFGFLFLSGVMIIGVHENNYFVAPEKGSRLITGCVEDVRTISDRLTIVTLKARQHSNNAQWFKAQFFLSKVDSLLLPGTIIGFKANLFEIENRGNPGEFDFKMYLKRKHILFNGWIYDYTVLGYKKNYRYHIWRLKEKIQYYYDKGNLRPENKALIFALTSGDKSLITKSQRSAFADSGVIHMLAVSGLHVGIIYLIISLIFKPLRRGKSGKRLYSLVIAVLLIAYAVFTGLSPSVSRAVLMFLLIDLVRFMNKPYLIYNMLFVSAFLIILVDPHYLFEPGFWLSYGAVASILLVMKLFQPFLATRSASSRKVLEMGLVTLSAQPGTFPLVLYWFNQFPRYFMFTNILVVPLLGLVLCYNFFFILMGMLKLPLDYIAVPLDSLLWYLNAVPRFFANVKGAVASVTSVDFTSVLIMYTIIALLIKLFYSQNLRLLKITGIVVICGILYNWVHTENKHAQHELVIFNDPKSLVIAERTGRNGTVFGNDSLSCVLDYVESVGIKPYGVEPLNDFMFAQGELFQLVKNNGRVHDPGIDRYLIFEGFNKLLPPDTAKIKMVIIAANSNESDRNNILEWCKSNNIPCHDIKNKGAFVLKKNLLAYNFNKYFVHAGY